MGTFATGILAAIVLAGGTYWAMQTWTVTVVDRTNDRSTIIGGIDQDQGAFREPVDTQ